VKQECRYPDKVYVQQMDLNDIDELKVISANLNQKFKIDILVNNGGTSMREEFINLTLKMVTQMMRVNYLSTAALCRYIGNIFYVYTL
jgi:short-subunit dehydrogenase